MLKQYIKTILVISILFTLSCGEKERVQVQEGDEEIVLSMWIMPNSARPAKDVQEVLAGFYEKHPNIRVEITSLDWGAAWPRITTAVTSKVGPDIVQIGSTWVGTIDSMGGLLDITQKVERDIGRESFIPEIREVFGLGDRITTVPWIVDTRALFYRTDIFEKLGLTVKDIYDWKSFENTLGKLNETHIVSDAEANLFFGEEAKEKEPKDGYFRVYPFGMPGKNDWNVIHFIAPWIWAFGGDFMNYDNTMSALYTEESFRGLEFYTGLVTRGYVPKWALEQNTFQIATGFAAGKYVMYMDGPWTLRAFEIPEEEGGAGDTLAATRFGVAPYPKGPVGRYTFLGSSNLAIFENSDYPEEAWKVVKYLIGKEAQLKYHQLSGFLPSMIEAFESPLIYEDPKRRVFKESAMSYGRVYPCIAQWGPLETVLTRRLGIIWDNVAGVFGEFTEKDLREQIDYLVREMNHQLARGADR